MRYIIIFMLLFAGIFSCEKSEDKTVDAQLPPGTHKITVEDVLQANNYTYINAKENDRTYWIAVTKRELEKGSTYFYSTALEMKNFQSKDLDRTFDTIYFVENLSDQPMAAPHGMDMMPKSVDKRKSSLKDEGISVEPVSGGITIGELAKNVVNYSGKTVKIRGQVTKFNPAIMGKNWAHIQDGTSSGDYYDLTVTTNAMVKVGEIVTFEGTIAINKDFGSGYSYDYIMENAKILSPNPAL